MKRPNEFPFLVKICGITAVEDGQTAIDAGANALGFNFYQGSPRFVTPERARVLIDQININQINGRYLRVGVFVNASEAELCEAASLAGLDVLQLHGRVPASLPRNVRLWRAMSADASPAANHLFDAYLLDTPSAGFGGSGVPFDWSKATGFPAPFLLAGGLHAGNVREAITTARPAGVDSCSRLEATPGRKDPELVKAFVQAAFEAHRQLVNNEMTVNV